MIWNKIKERFIEARNRREFYRRIYSIDWEGIHNAINEADIDQVVYLLRKGRLDHRRPFTGRTIVDPFWRGDPHTGSYILHELLRYLSDSYCNGDTISIAVKELLRLGCDPTVQDKNGQTAIHILIQNDQHDTLCLYLIDTLMDFVDPSQRRSFVDTIDVKGKSAIFYAKRIYSSPGKICKLLGYSADPFLGDPTRAQLLHTLLYITSPKRHIYRYAYHSRVAVSRLLELRADPKIPDTNGQTALHVLAQNQGGDDFDRFLDNLLSFVNESEKGDYINAVDNEGKSAIVYAANTVRGASKVLKLLDASADPFVGDPTGSSILFGLLDDLRRFDDIDDMGFSDTRETKEHESLCAITRLLELGIDPTEADTNGQTVLHALAKTERDFDFRKFLTTVLSFVDEAEKVQFVNAPDTDGKNAIFYATGFGRPSDEYIYAEIRNLLDLDEAPSMLQILAIEDRLRKKSEIISTLLQNGADPTMEDNQGNSPLNYLGDPKIFDSNVAFLLLTHMMGSGYQ